MTPTTATTEVLDVIVVGGGHAAGAATPLLGLYMALFTLNLDRIAWLLCKPAMRGLAKIQLEHEVGTLGSRPTSSTIHQFCIMNEVDFIGVDQFKSHAPKHRATTSPANYN